jgi:hypothetical protein
MSTDGHLILRKLSLVTTRDILDEVTEKTFSCLANEADTHLPIGTFTQLGNLDEPYSIILLNLQTKSFCLYKIYETVKTYQFQKLCCPLQDWYRIVTWIAASITLITCT